MSTAQTTTQTTSYLRARFLCLFRGYRVQFRQIVPCMSLFGAVLYYNVWVLAPTCGRIVA